MALARELTAWAQMIALTGKARRWEPKRLWLRIFPIAGRLACSGRSLRLRLAKTWPGAAEHRRNHPPAGHPLRLTSPTTDDLRVGESVVRSRSSMRGFTWTELGGAADPVTSLQRLTARAM